MKNNLRIRRGGSERGSVMIYTLLSLLVLSMFLALIYERVIDLMRSSRGWLWTEKALASAESGSALAEARLLADPRWSVGEGHNPSLKFTLDEADVEVRTEKLRPPDIVWIFSTGVYKRSKKETVRPVKVEDPLLFALMAHRSVKLGPGTIVTGSVYGSHVRMDEGSEVVGNIISSGSLDLASEQKEASIFDSATTPPEVPLLDMKPFGQSWTQTVSDKNSAGSLKPGYYMTPGDLTLRDVTETNVSIRVAGSLKLEGKVLMRFTSPVDTPILIIGKNLEGTLAGAKLRGVIYVGGKVSLKGEGLIIGTLIADEIDLSGGVVVQSFDASPNEQIPPAGFWKRRVRRIRN